MNSFRKMVLLPYEAAREQIAKSSVNPQPPSDFKISYDYDHLPSLSSILDRQDLNIDQKTKLVNILLRQEDHVRNKGLNVRPNLVVHQVPRFESGTQPQKPYQDPFWPAIIQTPKPQRQPEAGPKRLDLSNLLQSKEYSNLRTQSQFPLERINHPFWPAIPIQKEVPPTPRFSPSPLQSITPINNPYETPSTSQTQPDALPLAGESARRNLTADFDRVQLEEVVEHLKQLIHPQVEVRPSNKVKFWLSKTPRPKSDIYEIASYLMNPAPPPQGTPEGYYLVLGALKKAPGNQLGFILNPYARNHLGINHAAGVPSTSQQGQGVRWMSWNRS